MMEKIEIGKITSAVGLKGEVKVYNYSDSADIYRTTEEIFVGEKRRKIQNVRTQKSMVILKLEGIDDRNAAERARGEVLCITEADLPELPEGQFYIRDLIGMDVVDAETGDAVGTVRDVIQNTAQDIFDVKTPDGKQVLIPKVPEFIIEIDSETRVIKVKLIEGMLP
ncbi:MAG: 16S rRNA processing protein RimM [Firmicutes bacterium]|nr:16S rRNA processing protein RimM [Bacillota bacterium]